MAWSVIEIFNNGTEVEHSTWSSYDEAAKCVKRLVNQALDEFPGFSVCIPSYALMEKV